MLFTKKVLKIAQVSVALLFAGITVSDVSVSASEVKNENVIQKDQSSDFSISDAGELVLYTGTAEKVVIPKDVKKIACGAFCGHSEIKEISFSKNITCIDDYAFYGCSGIKEVILPDALKVIGRLAFGDCENLEKIYIGVSTSEIMEFFTFGCHSLKSIDINPKNKHFKSINGMLCTKDGTALIACPLDIEGKIQIPDTVVTIKECSFYECKKIEEVYAGDNLKYIDEAAFYGCENLRKVEFGNSVKKIRAYAFSNCLSLEKFDIKENLTAIGNNAFCGCKNLKAISILSNDINFGHKVFEDCPDLTITAHPGGSVATYALKHNIDFQNL
ncbi:MAG: leucine-rich repeat domain-containing protein [Acutalibacteraceae bacterium]